jgi:SAM-dependent methyltransferase
MSSRWLPRGDIVDIHREALARYARYRDLLNAAAVFRAFIGRPLRGTVADLGSGTGIGAAMLSELPSVGRMYAVEYSEGFVEYIMPIVFHRFSADASRIVRVVGDFNRLELMDSSLNAILEIGAFHHSDNLAVTLNEACRVLRPSGLLILIDRAHPDSVSEEEFRALLEKTYDTGFLVRYSLSEENPVTREWGGNMSTA